MSLPVTAEEKARHDATASAAGPADNVVSTACPQCHTRFAMLAKFKADGWHMRCTVCGGSFRGELKTTTPG